MGTGHFDTTRQHPMRLHLTRGEDGSRIQVVSSAQEARSTIALYFRHTTVGKVDILSLDSFLVARAETEELAKGARAEWQAVLDGTRHGFDLSSALALSAEMAPNEGVGRPHFSEQSKGRRKWYAQSAGGSIMTCLLSFLTVELCRGRSLDCEGLAPGYEIFGYIEKTFTHIIRPVGPRTKGEDLGRKAKFHVDPTLTRQIYSVIATAERTARQVQDPSWDPLYLNTHDSNGPPCAMHQDAAGALGVQDPSWDPLYLSPYDSRPPCALHRDAAGALGDPSAFTEVIRVASRSKAAFTYTIDDAHRHWQTNDHDTALKNLECALKKITRARHGISRPTDTDAPEDRMSLDDGTEDPLNVRLETPFDELLEEEAFAEASGSQA